MAALQEAAHSVIDLRLPKNVLKSLLDAAVDPAHSAQTWPGRAAVDVALDLNAPPDIVKAVADAGIQVANGGSADQVTPTVLAKVSRPLNGNNNHSVLGYRLQLGTVQIRSHPSSWPM